MGPLRRGSHHQAEAASRTEMNWIPSLVLLGAWAAAALTPGQPGRLPIINDDYARARAEAVRRHVPVFVEAWAPW